MDIPVNITYLINNIIIYYAMNSIVLNCFAIDCLSIGSSVHSETVWYSGGDGHYTRLGCIRHIRPLQDLQFARKNNTLSDKVRSTACISNRATNETHISRKVFIILIMYQIMFIMLYYIYTLYVFVSPSQKLVYSSVTKDFI